MGAQAKKTPPAARQRPARGIQGSREISQSSPQIITSEQAFTSECRRLAEVLAGREAQIATVRLMLQEILRSGTLERAKIIAAGALATGDFKPLLTLGQLERNVTALRTVGRRPAR